MTTAAIGGSSAVLNNAYLYPEALTPDALMVYLSTRLGGLDEQIQGIFGDQQKADKVRSAVNGILAEVNSLTKDTETNKELTTSSSKFDNLETLLDNLAALDLDMAQALRSKLSEEGFILHGESPPPPVQVVNTAYASGGNPPRRIPVSDEPNDRVTRHPDSEGADPKVTTRPINNGHSENHTAVDPEQAVAAAEAYADAKAAEAATVTYTTAEIENTSEFLKGIVSDLESTSQMNMINLQSLMSSRQTAVSLSTNLISKLSESMQKIVDNIR